MSELQCLMLVQKRVGGKLEFVGGWDKLDTTEIRCLLISGAGQMELK